jgi:adenosylmethionine-8-amino-7-oxononanoate aminotransferase
VEGLEQGTDENGPIGHGWTYSAHPIGAAAGVANLSLIDSSASSNNAGESLRPGDIVAALRLGSVAVAHAFHLGDHARHLGVVEHGGSPSGRAWT